MREIASTSVGVPAVRRGADRGLIAVAVAATAIVVAVAARPDRGPGDAAVAAHLLATVAIVAGVVVHRPARIMAWGLVATGCTVQAMAAAVLVASVGDSIESGSAPALAALAYPSLFVGIAGITARSPEGGVNDPWSAIVAALVGTGTVLIALTLPATVRHSVSLTDAEWGGLLAAGDLVLAAVAVRATIGRGGRNWTAWLLAAGCVAWGNGHAEIGARLGEGTYDNGSTVVLFVVVGSLLVGAAALVPSMRRVPDTTPGDERRRVARSGVWLLALAPAVVLVVHVAEIDAGRLWVAVPAMSAIVVAASRTAWLTADLDGTGPATRPAAPDIEADVRPNAAPRHVG